MRFSSLSRTFRGVLGGILVVLLGGGSAGGVQAQEQGPSLRSVDRPVRVSVDPRYQWYETSEGASLTQLSTRLSASVPLGQRVTVQAQGSYAQMGGEDLTQVRGLTDVLGRVTYARPVGEGSVVLSMGVNAPTGKQRLNDDEMATARALSQNYYDFEVSSFSRGFSVGPQVTWAFPIGDNFAVGIGGTYTYQRGFRPTAELTEDSLYVPGDGVGVNGGFDYKLTSQSALGLDVSFRRYGTDQAGGVARFEAGTRMTGTLRYLLRDGFTSVRVLARYANWEESEFAFRLEEPRRGQVIPSHGLLLASYRTRLTERLRLTTRVSGHWYDETVQSDAKTLGRLYVSPSIQLGDVLSVAPHGRATYGSHLGVGGGVRIAAEF